RRPKYPLPPPVELYFGCSNPELEPPDLNNMKTKIIITSGNPSPFRQLFTLHFRSYAPAAFSSSFSNGKNEYYDEYDYDSVARLVKLVHQRCNSGNLRVNEALGFLDSLIRKRPLCPPFGLLIICFGALSHNNHCSTVVSMYKRMMGCLHFRPDVCTVNTVIKCLCLLKKVDLSFSVLATLYKHGPRPDAHTLNTLLHGLCAEGSMVAAMELFQDIVEKKHPCDVVTYQWVL
ncbi:Pentatricopeptide repeat, partial [Parasponia andersonii]